MLSASSNTIILNGGQGYFDRYSFPSPNVDGCESWVLAKFLILSRTTFIPRSSEAFNSRIREGYNAGPKRDFANARIVDVLPVPGGP